MSKKLNVKQLILIGLLLRLLVMPFTAQRDLFFIYEAPHFLSHGQLNALEIPVERYGLGYYAPLSFIFFTFIQFIFRFFLPGYEEFLHLMSDDYAGGYFELGLPHLFLSLFFMKLPYLVFDFFLIKACWKMISDENNKRLFTVFWAMNPVVIYGTYMMGQLSLIPTYFVVLACYLSLQKGKEHYACLSIAAGTLFKLFPIVFLPMVLLIVSRNIRDFFRFSLYGIVPIVFFFGIFYLINGNAVFEVFEDTSKQTMGMATNYKVIAIRLLQAGIYALVCIHIVFYRPDRSGYYLLIRYFLAVYLAIYLGLSIHYTHHLTWFIPFFILIVLDRPEWKRFFYLLLVIIFLAGLRGRTSSLGIFASLNPEFFLSLPSLMDVTGFLFNQIIYDKVINFLFYGITTVLLISIFKDIYYYRPFEKRVV